MSLNIITNQVDKISIKDARCVSFVGFIILLITLPFENGLDFFRYFACIIATLPWFVYVCTRFSLKDFSKVVVQYIVLVSLGLIFSILFSKHKITLVAGYFLFNIGFLLFSLLMLFHAFSFVYPKEIQQFPKTFFWIRVTLFGFVFWSLMSSFSSLHPDISFRYFRKELIPYVFLFLVLVQSMTLRYLKKLLLVGTLVGVIVALLSIGESILYNLGSYGLKNWLMDNDIVKAEFYQTFNPLVKSQFPFEHNNRLGSYLLIVGLLMVVTCMLYKVRKNHVLYIFLPIVFLGIVCSMTRGAIIAFIGGLIVFFMFYKKKSVLFISVILLSTFVLSPEQIKKRCLNVFNFSSYFSSTESSLYSRRLGIYSTFKLITDYPFLGVGYGHHNLRAEFIKYQKEWPRWSYMSNTHNNFLEVTAETGIPGGVLFLSFSILTFIILLKRYFLPSTTLSIASTAAFLGLLLAIHGFGLTSLSIRYNNGILIWIVFAIIVVYSNLSQKPSSQKEHLKIEED